MNVQRKRENALQWYVMRCRRAADVAADIDAFQRNPSIPEQDRIADYFIPARAIERQSVGRYAPGRHQSKAESLRQEAALRSNAIRNTLSRFVFLQIRPSGLARLASQSWNGEAKRLFHYRDYDGEEITVSQTMMARFMQACMEYGSKLEICSVRPTREDIITKGLAVTLREGALAGLEAEVVALQYKAEGLRFTVAVKLFSNGSYAYVHDRRPEDIVVSEDDAYVFNADFIDRVEDSLLTILKRRIKHKETPQEMEDNQQRLRSYYQLHKAVIDRPDLALRFDALMSVCASMLRINSAKTKYTKVLKQRLKQLRRQPDAYAEPARCLAYLLAALFAGTKDPVYRDELKTVVQTRLPADDILRRHLAILRWLR